VFKKQTSVGATRGAGSSVRALVSQSVDQGSIPWPS